MQCTAKEGVEILKQMLQDTKLEITILKGGSHNGGSNNGGFGEVNNETYYGPYGAGVSQNDR
jgi:hypothetical protein